MEIGTSVAGAAAIVFTEMKVIVEKTAVLSTAPGETMEAKGAGGELVDTKVGKNKYTFVCELFVKNGDSKPLEDDDGVVVDKYTVRLTPEDVLQEGFIMDNCSVKVEESWSEEIGKKWKYTFDGLVPAVGKILKPYTQA